MESMSQMWLTLIAVIGVLLVIVYLMRKSKYIKKIDSDMRIVGRLSLGPRSYLAKVKIGEKTILLGISPQNISYLCEIPKSDLPVHVDSGESSGKTMDMNIEDSFKDKQVETARK